MLWLPLMLYFNFSLQAGDSASENFNWNATYDKPIAILIGPGSIGDGEFEARRLAFHPRARIFGNAAAGGSSGSDYIDLGNSDWTAMLATGPQYLMSTHEYLSHKALALQEKGWFDRDDVVNGIDTVVQAAFEWIAEQTTNVADESGNTLPEEFALQQNYPSPFGSAATFPARSGGNPTTNIAFTLTRDAKVKLTVFNLGGAAGFA